MSKSIFLCKCKVTVLTQRYINCTMHEFGMRTWLLLREKDRRPCTLSCQQAFPFIVRKPWVGLTDVLRDTHPVIVVVFTRFIISDHSIPIILMIIISEFLLIVPTI